MHGLGGETTELDLDVVPWDFCHFCPLRKNIYILFFLELGVAWKNHEEELYGNQLKMKAWF